MFVRVFSRRNLIAIVAGVLLAGAPLVAFDFWLDGFVDSQGAAEVGTAARRAVALAESRLRQTIGALDQLAGRGVNSCATGHIEAMRQAAFAGYEANFRMEVASANLFDTLSRELAGRS